MRMQRRRNIRLLKNRITGHKSDTENAKIVTKKSYNIYKFSTWKEKNKQIKNGHWRTKCYWYILICLNYWENTSQFITLLMYVSNI